MKVATVVTTPAFHVSELRVLFDAAAYENTFGLSPDGRRRLMMRLDSPEQAPTQIHLILNFLAELRQRVR